MGIKTTLMRKSRLLKYNRFINAIENYSKKTDQFTILDVGVNTKEYSSEDNFFIQHYPYPKNITGLSIENHAGFREKYPDINLVIFDGNRIPFEANHFDFVHSNAVIEHVGSYEKQVYFIEELVRVADKMVYFTTPNRFFPIEMHTNIPLLHFFPKKVFDFFVSKTSKKWATGDYMFLLSLQDLKKMTKPLENNYKVSIFKQKLLGFTYQFIVCIIKK